MDFYMPHGQCFLWHDDVLYPYVIGNALIAVSYMMIPIMFLAVLRQRVAIQNLSPALLIYALFIASCGIGHLVMIWNLWHSDYQFEAYWNLGTGVISFIAAILSYRYINLAWSHLDDR